MIKTFLTAATLVVAALPSESATMQMVITGTITELGIVDFGNAQLGGPVTMTFIYKTDGASLATSADLTVESLQGSGASIVSGSAALGGVSLVTDGSYEHGIELSNYAASYLGINTLYLWTEQLIDMPGDQPNLWTRLSFEWFDGWSSLFPMPGSLSSPFDYTIPNDDLAALGHFSRYTLDSGDNTALHGFSGSFRVNRITVTGGDATSPIPLLAGALAFPLLRRRRR